MPEAPPNDFWLRAIHARDAVRERPFRIDVALPRELSEKLNQLQVEATKKTGRYVPKSSIVVAMMEQFFEKKGS
jgi:hypothetical protein